MGYIVESSIKLHKCSNYSKIKNFILNQSHKKNCEFVYENYELEGTAYSEQKNYCIITTEFSEENPEDCAAFLRTLRETTEIMVECVYVERGKVQVLFASSHYKTIMDKNALKNYKKFRGQKIYSKPYDEIVVNELYNINRFSK